MTIWVYGIDEDWLRSNPYMCCTSAREFYEKFHNEVLIIHAHPYRDGNTTVFEDAVDGTEIINWQPRHENHSDRGVELCRRHPNYFRLAGSDTHRTVMRPVRASSCRSGSGTPSNIRQ